MGLTPSIVPTVARFRGASSSTDYNATLRAAHNDLINAYAQLQRQLAATQLTNEVLSVQNSAYQQALSGIKGQIASLTAEYAGLRAFGSSAAGSASVLMSQSLYNTTVSYGGFPSYFPVTSPQSTQSRASYSAQYGQVTPNLSIAPLSKAFVTDLVTQQLVYPPNVVQSSPPLVTPTIQPYAIEDNDLTNAVDGDLSTYWRRNVYFAANQFVSSVSTTVTLTLPEQYVNNLTCNYVTIHPYPEFGMDITSVVLHGAPGSADQQLLATDIAGNIIPISQAAKTRLIFPDSQVVSIEITMSQSNPNLNLKPGLQAFTLGASVLDFGYMTFNQNPSTVLVPFTLGNNYFSVVNSINPIVPGVSYRLFYLSSNNDLVLLSLGSSIPGFVQTIYVEVSLSPATGVVPQLSSLQINFLPVYLLN